MSKFMARSLINKYIRTVFPQFNDDLIRPKRDYIRYNKWEDYFTSFFLIIISSQWQKKIEALFSMQRSVLK